MPGQISAAAFFSHLAEEQRHFAMLHQPSGTDCKTRFTQQKTLLLFSASWNCICLQLSDSPLHLLPLILFPTFSSPYNHLPPPPINFKLLCQAQQACGLLHGVGLHFTSGHQHWHFYLVLNVHTPVRPGTSVFLLVQRTRHRVHPETVDQGRGRLLPGQRFEPATT